MANYALSAKPVYFKKGKAQNVPDHDPPPGYICYRCHEKGMMTLSNFSQSFANTVKVTGFKLVLRTMIRTLRTGRG